MSDAPRKRPARAPCTSALCHRRTMHGALRLVIDAVLSLRCARPSAMWALSTPPCRSAAFSTTASATVDPMLFWRTTTVKHDWVLSAWPLFQDHNALLASAARDAHAAGVVPLDSTRKAAAIALTRRSTARRASWMFFANPRRKPESIVSNK